jgi:hypothetical protein
MLTIRKEQMDVFREARLSQNLSKLVKEFELKRGARYLEMGAERAEAFIEQAVKKGLGWGIRGLKDVWALIEIMLDFGLDFAAAPSRPWADGILNSEKLSGKAKVKLVTAHLRGDLD